MTEESGLHNRSIYGIYLGAYNRNRRRLFRYQHQLRCARKLLKNGEVTEPENIDWLKRDIESYESIIEKVRKRLSFLEQNAERNGYDLKRRRLEDYE